MDLKCQKKTLKINPDNKPHIGDDIVLMLYLVSTYIPPINTRKESDPKYKDLGYTRIRYSYLILVFQYIYIRGIQQRNEVFHLKSSSIRQA